MDRLKHYYLFSMVPLFFFSLLLLAMGVSGLNTSLFLTSVLFPITLATPGLREKVSDSKYKFSVLRFLYKIQGWIDRKLKPGSPWWLKSFHRLFLSFLFTSFLVILSGAVNPLYFFLGWIWWEGFYRLNEKKNLVLIEALEDGSKTHPDFVSEESGSEAPRDHQNHQKDND